MALPKVALKRGERQEAEKLYRKTFEVGKTVGVLRLERNYWTQAIECSPQLAILELQSEDLDNTEGGNPRRARPPGGCCP